MIGDTVHGHVVAPVSPAVRERLVVAARRVGSSVDGKSMALL
jgi:predicted RNase H-like nuclease